jgi:hypothetical protein
MKKSILVFWHAEGRIDRYFSDGRVNKSIGSNHSRGYLVVGVERKMLFAHRLMYADFHGPIAPWMEIDHIDGNKKNNAIGNLRWVTRRQNMQNQKKAPLHNKSSGMLGVSLCKKSNRWYAQIMDNQKHTRIGVFDSKEDAHRAYLEVKRKIHEACTI